MDRPGRRGRRVQHRHGSQVRRIAAGGAPAPPRKRRASERRQGAMTTRPTVRRSFAPRGVIGGAVLLAVGVAFLLAAIGFPQAEGGRYLFLALGLAFAAAYALGPRQFVYLLPAGALTGLGVGPLIPAWFGLPPSLPNPAPLAPPPLRPVAALALPP